MKDVHNGGESSNDWVGDSSSEKAELEGAEVKGLETSHWRIGGIRMRTE